MCGRSRAPVDVEGYAQLGKGILDDGMIAVYDILRGDTLFFGLDGDEAVEPPDFKLQNYKKIFKPSIFKTSAFTFLLIWYLKNKTI